MGIYGTPENTGYLKEWHTCDNCGTEFKTEDRCPNCGRTREYRKDLTTRNSYNIVINTPLTIRLLLGIPCAILAIWLIWRLL